MIEFRKRTYPFTGDDLRYIAAEIDKVNAEVGDAEVGDRDWRWGLEVAIFDDANQIVGYMRPQSDGWLGFYPVEVA